jgi:hypothetical protein
MADLGSYIKALELEQQGRLPQRNKDFLDAARERGGVAPPEGVDATAVDYQTLVEAGVFKSLEQIEAEASAARRGAFGRGAREALEIGGSIAGGAAGGAGGAAIGGPGAPATAFAGRALGAGVGATGGQALADLFGLPEAGIEAEGLTPGERLKRRGAIAAEGALGEVVGSAIPGGLGKLKRFVAPNRIRAAAKNLELERRIQALNPGFRFTPAELTGSKIQSLLEEKARNFATTSAKAEAFDAARNKTYEEIRRGYLKEAGGEVTSLEAGILSQEALAGKKKLWKSMHKNAYASLKEIVPSNEVVPVSAMTEVINEEIVNLAGLSKGLRAKLTRMNNAISKSNSLGKRMEALQGQRQVAVNAGDEAALRGLDEEMASLAQEFMKDGLPWAKLQTERAALGDMIGKLQRTGKNNEARIFTRVKEALDTDLQAFSDSLGGEAKELFDFANLLFREGLPSGPGQVAGANVFRNPLIQKGIEDANPQLITKMFLRPNNVKTIKLLKQAVGEEGMQPLKRQWLTDVMSQGIEDAPFDVVRFAKTIEKYDDATLMQFLGKEEMRGLKDMARAIRRRGDVLAKGGNFSGTARAIEIPAIAVALYKEPISTLIALVGINSATSAYFKSPAARRVLIEGFRANPRTAAGSRALIQASIMLGVEDEMEELFGLSEATRARRGSFIRNLADVNVAPGGVSTIAPAQAQPPANALRERLQVREVRP